MLRSSSIVAALIALACTSACLAQDKPAETASLPGSKSINLQLEAASPEEAFAELAKQADIQIKPMSQNIWAKADPVELTVENGKFWPVFIDMCQQANVRFNPMFYTGEPRTVQIFGPDQGMEMLTKLPQVEVQGCILALMTANRNYQINYGSQNQSHTSFGVQGAFLPDPGVTFSGSLQVIVTEAVDENGTSLALPRHDGAMYGHEGRSLMRHIYIQLAYPANTGKKLVRLKGELKTSVIAKSETLTIALPMETPTPAKDLTNMSVEIKSVKSTANGAEAQVTIRTKRPMQTMGMEHQNTWNMLSTIELLDEKGNRFHNGGINRTGGSPTALEATVQFFKSNPAQMGQPAKLNWVLPVETKEVRLPFEFKDLPIP